MTSIPSDFPSSLRHSKCYRCKHWFYPSIVYKFPLEYRFWHVCPDGFIACNSFIRSES